MSDPSPTKSPPKQDRENLQKETTNNNNSEEEQSTIITNPSQASNPDQESTQATLTETMTTTLLSPQGFRGKVLDSAVAFAIGTDVLCGICNKTVPDKLRGDDTKFEKICTICGERKMNCLNCASKFVANFHRVGKTTQITTNAFNRSSNSYYCYGCQQIKCYCCPASHQRSKFFNFFIPKILYNI